MAGKAGKIGKAEKMKHDKKGGHDDAAPAMDHGASGGDHVKTFDAGDAKTLTKAFLKADQVFAVNFTELNDSGVSGGSLLAVKGDKLTVITFADGVEPGQLHVQHIHGFLGAQDAVTPTAAADTDGDGFVELAEGLPFYGPIQVNLDPFPMPQGDSFFYASEFKLSDFGLTADNLDEHEIVLHGLTVPGGIGAGTAGEVDGTAGFKTVLPIAAGEIFELSDQQSLIAFVQIAAQGNDWHDIA